MKKNIKKQKAFRESTCPRYTLLNGIQNIINEVHAKFDESVELHINLGIDTKKSDQQIRSSIILPNGVGKNPKILAIINEKTSGIINELDVYKFGGIEIVNEIYNGGKIDFDIVITTPDMMLQLGKIARILGPRGLMPSLKNGTVGPDIKAMVLDIKKGRVEFRADKYGIVHCPLGKVSFGEEKLLENARFLITKILDMKPPTSKGKYIKEINICSTMGIGYNIISNNIQMERISI